MDQGISAGPGSGFGSMGSVAPDPAPTPRAEFGAHLEANYPRLVAQLCMITLSPGQAHDLVQEAYARAWQRWSTVRELPNPTGWIRQMAVRSSGRRWRRMLSRLGIDRSGARSGEAPSDDPGQLAVLEALGGISSYRRRALVLADVAHLPLDEVARIEGVSVAVAESRLVRARTELNELLATRPPTDPAVAAPWEDM